MTTVLLRRAALEGAVTDVLVGDGIVTAIIPARTAVQGLAALAVVDFDKGLRENAIGMTGAAVATRHGAVSIAAREVLTWAGSAWLIKWVPVYAVHPRPRALPPPAVQDP